MSVRKTGAIKLSIVIPCYNEEKSLGECVRKVMAIADWTLSLEVIIVDDCSKDGSLRIARQLERKWSQVTVIQHEKNMGKGAALRTGFRKATGDFVAVQDADLEYDPHDLKRLLDPLVQGRADVVLGSRFLTTGMHRVLYFWHSLGNKFLTLLSNMFTDLNLTDMETCYKVFRREIIQSIEIKEDRFGFEPEIVAKVAHLRLRIYEMGISYYGRTYAEGKKIGVKDGLRALYCILRYNAHMAPVPIQFMIYAFIGGASALVNFLLFIAMVHLGCPLVSATLISFALAALCNYLLCIALLFRHKARWSSGGELVMYLVSTGLIGILDVGLTVSMVATGFSPAISKIIATGAGFVLNFIARRYLVFPEKPSGPWKPETQVDTADVVDSSAEFEESQDILAHPQIPHSLGRKSK